MARVAARWGCPSPAPTPPPAPAPQAKAAAEHPERYRLLSNPNIVDAKLLKIALEDVKEEPDAALYFDAVDITIGGRQFTVRPGDAIEFGTQERDIEDKPYCYVCVVKELFQDVQVRPAGWRWSLAGWLATGWLAEEDVQAGQGGPGPGESGQQRALLPS
jgi:hypothetical protein